MSTIKARIRVAVWPNGNWTAYGTRGPRGDVATERYLSELVEAAPAGESFYWVEAEIPWPPVIQGKVVP